MSGEVPFAEIGWFASSVVVSRLTLCKLLPA